MKEAEEPDAELEVIVADVADEETAESVVEAEAEESWAIAPRAIAARSSVWARNGILCVGECRGRVVMV